MPGKPVAVVTDSSCARCRCFESRHLPSGQLPGARPCAGGCSPRCENFQSERREDEVEHIDHPSHYGGNQLYEAIAVMEAWAKEAGWDPVQITNLTQALKYIRRHGQKPIAPADQDLEKAIWHIKRVVAHLRGRDG